ncbi:alpha/beta hydrolase [uncultured Shewanella sp.]|uniref:alpha/beta hydrolase n=1 Tax=Shewanella atlantica TaxID=271099 RepID=UPI002633F34D|nr:alpha/beta hydrolase [uncultured Shewanella sp.]
MLYGEPDRSVKDRSGNTARVRPLTSLIPPLVIGTILFSLPAFANTMTGQAVQTSPAHCYVDDLPERLDCGFVTVPENRNKPDGKQIDIHYVVLPAIKSGANSEAFLAIAGGPGQSAIDNAAGFSRIFNKVRQKRDILLIDQRGTGRSNQLKCEGEGFEGALSIDEANFDVAKETQACLDELDADVTQYGSLNALEDFEAVRKHLGYRKLHLYGISYGTRMAQLYQRHYPQVLSTVTIDGVVPMQQNVLAIGSAISRGFELLLQDCESNSLCGKQFPNLKDDLNKVETKLAAAPAVSQVRDPLTGESTQLTMTRSKFMGAIRMALYMPNVRALIPHAISEAAKENFQPIMGLYALTIDSTGIAMGMHASVVCGEDWQRLTPKERELANQTYFGKEMITNFEKSCAIWNMPTVDASFSEPVSSDIPTLVLSGQLDPATPPSWGDLAMEKLTNAKHFIAPFATHGVANQSCGNDLIAELVETGDVKKLDGECLNRDVSRNFYLNASTVEAIPSAETTQGASHD